MWGRGICRSVALASSGYKPKRRCVARICLKTAGKFVGCPRCFPVRGVARVMVGRRADVRDMPGRASAATINAGQLIDKTIKFQKMSTFPGFGWTDRECRRVGGAASAPGVLVLLRSAGLLLFFSPGRFPSGMRDSSLCGVTFDDTPGARVVEWIPGQLVEEANILVKQ